jgi:hypothetical protein
LPDGLAKRVAETEDSGGDDPGRMAQDWPTKRAGLYQVEAAKASFLINEGY